MCVVDVRVCPRSSVGILDEALDLTADLCTALFLHHSPSRGDRSEAVVALRAIAAARARPSMIREAVRDPVAQGAIAIRALERGDGVACTTASKHTSCWQQPGTIRRPKRTVPFTFRRLEGGIQGVFQRGFKPFSKEGVEGSLKRTSPG